MMLNTVLNRKAASMEKYWEKNVIKFRLYVRGVWEALNISEGNETNPLGKSMPLCN